METATMTNTMVVQQAYGYFGEGNIPALLDLLSEDVKCVQPLPKDIIPWGGVHLGRAGVGEFFSMISENVEFNAFEPREFIEQNNKVVALGYMEGKIKNTGKVSKTDWVMVFTFKGGKIVHFQEYSDTYVEVKAFLGE